MRWMFAKRPLAVKDFLMVICFWEFHWFAVEAVWRQAKRRVASLNSRLVSSIANCRHSLYLIVPPPPSWEILVRAYIALILRSGL